MNWINVEDRLPELPTDPKIKIICRCLVANDRGVVFEAIFFINYKTFYYLEEHRKIKNITHWMPLPKPPRIKNNL